MIRKRLAIVPLALLPMMVSPYAAGEQSQRPDYEIARDAVEKGEILPLNQLLSILQQAHPGRVVEIDLEFSDGRLVYEVEIVTDTGRLIEIVVDAGTGAILGYDDD